MTTTEKRRRDVTSHLRDLRKFHPRGGGPERGSILVKATLEELREWGPSDLTVEPLPASFDPRWQREPGAWQIVYFA